VPKRSNNDSSSDSVALDISIAAVSRLYVNQSASTELATSLLQSSELGLETALSYRQLESRDSIRLLLIEPIQSTSPYTYTLEHCSLSNLACEYEAISYAWGDASKLVPLLCKGGMVRVTQNLQDALRSFQHQSKSRYIWADAICINQNDVKERNHQVGLMRRIFSSAARVLIWLGRDDNGLSVSAYTTLRSVVNVAAKLKGTSKRAEILFKEHVWPTTIDKSSGQLETIPPATSSCWDSVSHLFNLSWFWRIWCIQEVSLAQDAVVRWGVAEMSWDDLGLAAALLRTNHYDILSAHHIPGLFNAYFVYRISKSGSELPPLRVSFLRLLGLTRQFEASDPRDRIYGLLGIPVEDYDEDNSQLFIEPDYSQSTEEVYEGVAKKLLTGDHILRLLSSIQHGPSDDERYPSWVPRWHQVFTQSIIPSDPTMAFNASKALPAQFGESNNPQQLKLRGLNLQGIESIFPIMADADLMLHKQTERAGLRDYVRLETNFERLAYTLTAGKDWYGTLVADRISHFEDCASYLCTIGVVARSGIIESWRTQTTNSPPPDSTTTSAMDERRFAEAALNACNGRRLFRSGNFFGLGPAAMQAGDRLAIFFGATVPFVLRKVNIGEGERWRLVGDCYVHDLMDGQIVDKFENGDTDIKEAWFEII
jgi:Heterokaryon incompatibility protein (HET)